MKIFVFIAFLYLSFLGIGSAYSQNMGIQNVPTPQYSNYGGGNVPMPNVNGQVHLGATADDIMRQASSNIPFYKAPGDSRSTQQVNEDYIRQRMAQDPAYNPTLRNAVSNNAPISKEPEFYRLLNGVVASSRPIKSSNPQEFAQQTKPYTDALESLKAMLSGKKKLFISEAYYTMEQSWGTPYLTKEEFKSILKESTDFIREWMLENKLNIKDNAAINHAVQKFMGEQLSIAKTIKTNDGKQTYEVSGHQPFSYDFNDNKGAQDHRNFFLTKCLATGTGQCNSMPAVYLSLVEALGGSAYLAMAPQHSLIKYPDGNGNLRNYEATSNWSITNEWYEDNMFISATAMKNQLYLYPYDNKQIVADIVLQLALGYHRKFGAGDGRFALDCINAAKPYFPKNNNLAIYFTYSNLYGAQLVEELHANGSTSLDDIQKSPKAQNIYAQWEANEDTIKALGYVDMPKGMYEELLKYDEFRGRKQQGDGKTKRNLFIKTK